MRGAVPAVDGVGPTKVCFRCKQPKDLERGFHKNRSRSDGVQAQCKECSKKYVHPRSGIHAHGQRGYFLLWRYGISEETYQRILAAQYRRCAICGIHEDEAIRPGRTRLKGGVSHGIVVDHCHETGRVRGLLCNRCNRAMGAFEDNAELLDKAASYLRRSCD